MEKGPLCDDNDVTEKNIILSRDILKHSAFVCERACVRAYGNKCYKLHGII